MPRYVVNVDSWGSSPMYRRGEVVPDDCPYDVEAAVRRGRLVTDAEYQKAHPDWDPERAEQVEAAHTIGRDVPSAADLPSDPTAGRETEGDEPLPLDAQPIPKPSGTASDKAVDLEKPIAVQQPSNPSAPPGSSSRKPAGG